MPVKQNPVRFLTHPGFQLFLATSLFYVSMQLSRGADMQPWEVSLFNWVYNWPDFLKPMFFVLTQFGSIHVLSLLILGFLVFRRYNAVVRLLLTSMMAYLVSGFAKDIWGRARPNELLAGVENLDYIVRGPGFPSGHTALVTAMAFVVARYVPSRYRWVLFALIAFVGVSRLYLGIHAPLDIVGGFAIGWGAYALFCYVRIRNALPDKKSAKSQKTKPRRAKR